MGTWGRGGGEGEKFMKRKSLFRNRFNERQASKQTNVLSSPQIHTWHQLPPTEISAIAVLNVVVIGKKSPQKTYPRPSQVQILDRTLLRVDKCYLVWLPFRWAWWPHSGQSRHVHTSQEECLSSLPPDQHELTTKKSCKRWEDVKWEQRKRKTRVTGNWKVKQPKRLCKLFAKVSIFGIYSPSWSEKCVVVVVFVFFKKFPRNF